MNYVIGKLVDRLTFRPLRESTYEFLMVGDELKLKLSDRDEIVDDAEVGYWPTAHGNTIAYMFVRSARRPSKAGIVYSNGNSGDMGMVYDFIVQLAAETCCDVLTYDYTGFGRSTRRPPSERSFYADADAAVDALRSRYGYRTSDTILYGFSLGTAACLAMAADERRRFAGVVLQSPLLSVGRVAFGRTFHSRYDRFDNAGRADRVRCPVLLVHDELDDMVPVSHALTLRRLLAHADLMVTRGHGHAVPFWKMRLAVRKFVDRVTAADGRTTAFRPPSRHRTSAAENAPRSSNADV